MLCSPTVQTLLIYYSFTAAPTAASAISKQFKGYTQKQNLLTQNSIFMIPTQYIIVKVVDLIRLTMFMFIFPRVSVNMSTDTLGVLTLTS